MFNFFGMADNYEDRKVDNTKLSDSTTIDTCYVTDGFQPYETGVEHPKYNNGKWVIVEAYDTKEEAQAGHDKWVKIMSSIPLPEKLVDCGNAKISSLTSLFGVSDEFEFDDGE